MNFQVNKSYYENFIKFHKIQMFRTFFYLILYESFYLIIYLIFFFIFNLFIDQFC